MATFDDKSEPGAWQRFLDSLPKSRLKQMVMSAEEVADGLFRLGLAKKSGEGDESRTGGVEDAGDVGGNRP